MTLQFDPIRLPSECEALRADVRAFLAEEIAAGTFDPYRPGHGDSHDRAFSRRIGAKGWIALHWPKQYGGGGKTLRDQLGVVEELAARYAKIVNSQVLHCTNILLVHGTEEQKMDVIPRAARGEIEVSLGYTEPNAGSDVANIQMRAVDKGDHFVISGEKIFNTMAHWASYHWMLARTDPAAKPKHRGLTMFLVDLKTPGITVRPIHTIDDSRTNLVHYDEVKVPKSRMFGE